MHPPITANDGRGSGGGIATARRGVFRLELHSSRAVGGTGRRQDRQTGPGRVNRRARNERDSSCTRRGLLEERAVARTDKWAQAE